MEKLSWEARRKGGWGETWDGGRAFREGSNLSKTASGMRG